jgi:starvation-inducible outer membrane lipoprotein
MTRALILALLLSACGPIPVQMSSQKQTQSSKQEVAQEAAQDAALTSGHESKQGTNSMPVIIICNTTNSANARCASIPENGPMLKEVQKRYGGEGK